MSLRQAGCVLEVRPNGRGTARARRDPTTATMTSERAVSSPRSRGDQINLGLKTVDLCFIVGLYLRESSCVGSAVHRPLWSRGGG
jgi:hypothetical protein